MAKCVNALKEWTGKASATIVYDSTVDEFTHKGLFDKVQGKPNIAVIGFTTDDDVFGGFYSVAVTQQGEDIKDPNLFVFSFESHGRCDTPQRFVPFRNDLTKITFFRLSMLGLVAFHGGTGFLTLGNERSESSTWNLSSAFRGLDDNTLTSKRGYLSVHHCLRLIALQLQ